MRDRTRFEPRTWRCRKCWTRNEASVCVVLDVLARPDLLGAYGDDSLHAQTCHRCGATKRLEVAYLRLNELASPQLLEEGEREEREYGRLRALVEPLLADDGLDLVELFQTQAAIRNPHGDYFAPHTAPERVPLCERELAVLAGTENHQLMAAARQRLGGA